MNSRCSTKLPANSRTRYPEILGEFCDLCAIRFSSGQIGKSPRLAQLTVVTDTVTDLVSRQFGVEVDAEDIAHSELHHPDERLVQAAAQVRRRNMEQGGQPFIVAPESYRHTGVCAEVPIERGEGFRCRLRRREERQARFRYPELLTDEAFALVESASRMRTASWGRSARTGSATRRAIAGTESDPPRRIIGRDQREAATQLHKPIERVPIARAGPALRRVLVRHQNGQ